jgi:hypothetical protein
MRTMMESVLNTDIEAEGTWVGEVEVWKGHKRHGLEC